LYLQFEAFAGVVTAAAAWSIWGQDMFPKEADPTGGMHNLNSIFLLIYSQLIRPRQMDDGGVKKMVGCCMYLFEFFSYKHVCLFMAVCTDPKVEELASQL
jgi:hypothetical protein